MPVDVLPIPAQAQTPSAIIRSDSRDSVVIASVWPKALTSEQPHCVRVRDSETGEIKIHGRTMYNIPAGSPSSQSAADSVQLLRVYDTFQMRTLPGEEQEVQPLPISCRSAAQGLVQMWTGVANGAESGNSIGLLVLAGDEPTKDELTKLVAAQHAYFQERFVAAQSAYQKGNLNEIGEVERMAARWLNMHSRVEWYSMTDAAGVRECLGCGGSLNPTATTCKNCGDLIDKALKGYWSETVMREQDPFLYERMMDVKRRAKDRDRKAKNDSEE